MGPIVISTWDFGRRANAAAWPLAESGAAALDVLERGLNDAENDLTNATVGGGLPNSAGEVTFDALVMDGRTHRAGAVGCLKRVRPAASVARRVLEKTPHTLIVGEDATRFALAQGFPETDLLCDAARRAYEDWKANRPDRERFPHEVRSHDTLGMVVRDAQGHIAAGCTTSGLAWKLPGRVGDSPIPGAGAYCDDDVGGAAATGEGDLILRFLPSFLAVELMRLGLSPRAACETALARMTRKGVRAKAAVIALAKSGEVGAACIGLESFPYAVRSVGSDALLAVD